MASWRNSKFQSDQYHQAMAEDIPYETCRKFLHGGIVFEIETRAFYDLLNRGLLDVTKEMIDCMPYRCATLTRAVVDVNGCTLDRGTKIVTLA